MMILDYARIDIIDYYINSTGIIELRMVVGQELWSQLEVISLIALAATVGVYGIVALIVRMDEMGNRLIKWSKGKNNFFINLDHF